MGTTIMGTAAVSLDGFIADDNDEVGPLFDWLGSGEVSWSLPGSPDEARSSRASADFMTSHDQRTTSAAEHRSFDARTEEVRDGHVDPRRNPLGRLGEPADVADAACFLASESASWLTGLVVDVPGGAVML
jgi:hypothetical protein